MPRGEYFSTILVDKNGKGQFDSENGVCLFTSEKLGVFVCLRKVRFLTREFGRKISYTG